MLFCSANLSLRTARESRLGKGQNGKTFHNLKIEIHFKALAILDMKNSL